MTQQAHIETAVREHGSQAKLAAALGCSQQLVSQMLTGRVRVTAEMAVKLDAATGGKVSRHHLRPDIFGPAPASEAAA